MELNEIQEFVHENLHDGGEGNAVGVDLIAAKLGQYAETRIRVQAAGGAIPEEERKEVMGDILASMLFVVAHAAEDEGVDLATATRKRLARMSEVYEKQNRFETAMKEGDLETIEDMLREDMEEAGLFDVEEDDSDSDPDSRGVY